MIRKYLAAALLALPLVTIGAPPAPGTRAEIDHLLDYVSRAGQCRFMRNGDWHDMAEARGHISRKYEFVASQGKANTAEAFIDNAASRSSISGKNYMVECAGAAAIPSGDWLRAELSRYRRKPR